MSSLLEHGLCRNCQRPPSQPTAAHGGWVEAEKTCPMAGGWKSESAYLCCLEATRKRAEALANAAAESGAMLDWMVMAIRGKPVSDFGESFSPVREAMDLRSERDQEQIRANDMLPVVECALAWARSYRMETDAREATRARDALDNAVRVYEKR